MRVVAVSVGMPQIVQTADEGFVTTAIFKKPVNGRVKVNELNLEGDAQADLRVHGGWSKAVYVYPSEHYEFWEKSTRTKRSRLLSSARISRLKDCLKEKCSLVISSALERQSLS
jgi:MOSC domain-containing protein YiiM